MSARKIFLLVDDDPRQRELMELEFQRPEINADLYVVEDAVAAQQYVSGEDVYRDRQKHPSGDIRSRPAPHAWH